MADNPLLTPVQVGSYTLPNRMVMAPLTRNRAGEGNVPRALNAEYYRQRASAGLIISEATQVSPQGIGYPHTPGIHTAEQVEGWKLVTEAVHGAGGRIFLQLWHVGRISHPSFQPNGALPVAPSAVIPSSGTVMTYEGEKDYVTPRALELDEIPGIIAQYRQGAENALQAGFDGVEVHGANGYLLDQFLQDRTNHRTDEYGGSIENRARLLLEVVQAAMVVWGSERVGVRLSPRGSFNDMEDSDPSALFGYVLQELDKLNLAYVHLIEPRWDKLEPTDDATNLHIEGFRQMYKGTLISAGGYTQVSGNAVLSSGHSDLVAFGRLFISNPDLPERFKVGAELNEYDRSKFYGGDAEGYTDYPFLSEAA